MIKLKMESIFLYVKITFPKNLGNLFVRGLSTINPNSPLSINIYNI
jgi:hypothetical protein